MVYYFLLVWLYRQGGWQRVIMVTISVNTGVDLLLRQMIGVTIAFRILAEVFKNMDPGKDHSTIQRKENNYW